VSSRPPPTAVLERFHHAAIRVLRAMREADGSGALSGPRASALSVLVFRGPQALGALARAEGVKPPTMSRLVKEMRLDGLVEPLAPGADRREVRIAASARGRRLLLAARARRIAALAKLFKDASAREAAALAAVADLVERAFGRREISRRRKPGE
jgi:DNA-binding MarR family transcriptional regulator